MASDLICSWLKLPSDNWPPDHYALLGLEFGDSDTMRIETQVHERLELVRRYQLIHPEPATEAMNLLAQAFVCLTNADTKKAYDAKIQGKELEPPTVEVVERVVVSESASVEAEQAEEIVPPLTDSEKLEAADELPANLQGETPVVGTLPEPSRPLIRVGKGLETKRALYHGLAVTRRLLRTWEQAGRYVARPTRRLNKPAEATDLIRQLTALRTQLQSFPPILGEAGQAGYLVSALSRQQIIVPTFQTLLPGQREALARDWRLAYRVLTGHRDSLRHELQAMRRRGPVGRAMKAVRSIVNERPGALLLLIGLLALNIAIIQEFWVAVGTKR